MPLAIGSFAGLRMQRRRGGEIEPPDWNGRATALRHAQVGARGKGVLTSLPTLWLSATLPDSAIASFPIFEGPHHVGRDFTRHVCHVLRLAGAVHLEERRGDPRAGGRAHLDGA